MVKVFKQQENCNYVEGSEVYYKGLLSITNLQNTYSTLFQNTPQYCCELTKVSEDLEQQLETAKIIKNMMLKLKSIRRVISEPSIKISSEVAQALKPFSTSITKTTIHSMFRHLLKLIVLGCDNELNCQSHSEKLKNLFRYPFEISEFSMILH